MCYLIRLQGSGVGDPRGLELGEGLERLLSWFEGEQGLRGDVALMKVRRQYRTEETYMLGTREILQ